MLWQVRLVYKLFRGWRRFAGRENFCRNISRGRGWCGAVSWADGEQECLFEAEDGAADGIVQAARGALCAGAKNEARADAGSGGVERGELWGGELKMK